MFSFGSCSSTSRIIFISILIVFVLHIFNDLDLDSQYFENVNAIEIVNYNNNNSTNNNGDDRNQRIDLYQRIFDSSKYF